MVCIFLTKPAVRIRNNLPWNLETLSETPHCSQDNHYAYPRAFQVVRETWRKHVWLWSSCFTRVHLIIIRHKRQLEICTRFSCAVYSFDYIISSQRSLVISSPTWLIYCGRNNNSRNFTDDIFKCIFVNVWIPIKIFLKFSPQIRINKIPALVMLMAWRLAPTRRQAIIRTNAG